ncbi:retrovirus-related pol polyprotein from transposon TNT 1-94 [Tanacetum coccineum]
MFRVKEEQDSNKSCEDDYNQVILSIIAAEDLHLEQLDVKTTFLHGDLDEDIYMTQPEGFQLAEKEENLVCKLKKSLYGLKQAPRQWYLKLNSIIQRAGYKRCAMDHCCYLKKVGSSFIILLLYVDDMLVVGFDMPKFKKLKRRRMAKIPYASAVGSVMYAMEAVKWLLRYLKGTSKATIHFSIKEVVIEGFFDLDYEGCLDSGKSTRGYVFTVGGTAVSWMSKIQKCIAMSTTESEYMATAEAGKELVWMENFLEELDRAQTECVWFCDNQSAIHLAKNLKILRAKNPADMLTKVVTREKLKLCAASTDLRDN